MIISLQSDQRDTVTLPFWCCDVGFVESPCSLLLPFFRCVHTTSRALCSVVLVMGGHRVDPDLSHPSPLVLACFVLLNEFRYDDFLAASLMSSQDKTILDDGILKVDVAPGRVLRAFAFFPQVRELS